MKHYLLTILLFSATLTFAKQDDDLVEKDEIAYGQKAYGLFVPTNYGKPILGDLNHSNSGMTGLGIGKNNTEFDMQDIRAWQNNRPEISWRDNVFGYDNLRNNSRPQNPYPQHWRKNEAKNPTIVHLVKVGTSIPFYSHLFYDKEGRKKFGIALVAPFKLDLIMDYSEAYTAPVRNVDYRYGSEIRSILYFHKPYFNNLVFHLRPFYHECNHLGNEYQDWRTYTEHPVMRNNASANYWEIAVTLNDQCNRIENNLMVKVGFEHLLPGRSFWELRNQQLIDEKNAITPNDLKLDGFHPDYAYSWGKDQVSGNFFKIDSIQISSQNKIKWEAYIQLQLQLNNSPISNQHWVHLFALEARLKTRYGLATREKFVLKDNPMMDYQNPWGYRTYEEAKSAGYNYMSENYYHKIIPETDLPAHKQLNYAITCHWGWKYYPSPKSPFNVGLYLHGYYGLYPYGQLRNVTHYWYSGIALVVAH